MYYMVNQLMKEQPNSIFLNAGDSFQGTLWYNLYGWNVTQHFLNMFPTDAYVSLYLLFILFFMTFYKKLCFNM